MGEPMSSASVDPADRQAAGRARQEAALNHPPESSSGSICESLINEIQLLHAEQSTTRQKLLRVRRSTKRLRVKVSRLIKANCERSKQTSLGGVGETALAEVVLAAQTQTKGMSVNFQKFAKPITLKLSEDATAETPLCKDLQAKAVIS